MSIKRNYIYNLLLTLSQFIFPLITFPYASRVLRPEGIGITSFVESFSRYFLLFAVAGIPIYGMREISINRNDTKLLNSIFSEIFSIQFFLTSIATIIYFACIFLFNDTEKYLSLYLLGGFFILTNIFSLEWVFQGFEDFKFIALRTIFIRVFTVIILFLLVKTPGDYVWYFFLLLFSSTANGLTNLFYVRKYLKLKLTTTYKTLKIHLKPIILTGTYLLGISIYSLLTTILLGFLSSNESVGYYTTATKFNRMALGLFSALSAVLVPRLSNMAGTGDLDGYSKLLNKSIGFVITFGIPVALSLCLMAPELIHVFAGTGYDQAIICVQIMSPIVLITGLAQVFGTQILIPFSRDRQNIIAVFSGAVLSLALNIVLIPLFTEIGASISTISVELLATILTVYFSLKILKINLEVKRILIYILILLPLIAFSILIRNLIKSDICVLLIYGFTSTIYFILAQVFLLKDQLIIQMINSLRKTKWPGVF